MEKFTTLTGIAAYLPMINVDTDMIIPKPGSYTHLTLPTILLV